MKSFILLLFFIFSTANLLAQNHDTQIKKMFADLELRGVDTNSELMYHYVFNDKDSTKLLRLSLELFSKGYKYIGIEKGDLMKYLLTVEKTEKHTALSMIQRDKDLFSLAKRYGVQEFEGFDINSLQDEGTYFENFRNKVAQSDSSKLFKWGNDLINNLMFAEGIIVFERCVAVNIKPDSSYFYQAYAYNEMEELEHAISNFEQANKINPCFFNASFNLGHIYRKIGKQDAAIGAYKKALDIRPTDDRALYALAYVLAENGDRLQALELCEKALVSNPKNTYAQTLLKDLR